MTGILIAFAITLLIPLFVATWRTSVLGLAVQGILMAWIALRNDAHFSIDTVLWIADLVALRTVAVPAVIYLVLRGHNAPRRNDVIAPNLFSWATALALVVVAFRCADILIPTEGDEQMLFAVAASAFLLGLFILATSRGIVSQITGLMRIENAIALYDLGSGSHHEPLAIRLAKTLLLLASVAFIRWYLVLLPPEDSSVTATTDAAVL